LEEVTEGNVEQLKEKFRDGLEDKCRVGAQKAESMAVDTSDAFAASMHWQTYRARSYLFTSNSSVLIAIKRSEDLESSDET
jgi:hypothetical protein